jgi:outer membrane protein assembly factor BamB
LFALDRQSGTLAFTIADPHSDWDGWTMGTAPVLTHDGDIVATHDGRMIRFDVQGRRIEWEVDRHFRGQATVKGDVIFANDGGALTAWNAVGGTLLWTWIAPGSEALDGNIVATDSHVFLQSASRTYAVNLSTRTVDWSHRRVSSPASLARSPPASR